MFITGKHYSQKQGLCLIYQMHQPDRHVSIDHFKYLTNSTVFHWIIPSKTSDKACSILLASSFSRRTTHD